MLSTTWDELWKLLRTDPLQRDVFYRLSVLTYELGDVHKAVVYKHYYGDTGTHAELKVALADLFAQLYIFCLSQGLDVEELEKLGLKRLGAFVTRRVR
ncbi:MAG: hypothetical protein DRN81_03680 [Thermoproteota archaeon]|nr:MAG: hypothetical protein DRN81_03680 [Candidatus Korarchaeota archaeon]